MQYRQGGKYLAARPRRSSRNARRQSAPRGDSPPGSAAAAKLIGCAVLIVFVFALRFAKDGPLFSLRESISSVLRTGVDYRETVEVLGQAVTGDQDGQDENAVLTFGKRFLGLDGAEPDEESGEEEDLPDAAENVFKDVSPEPKASASAGEVSGFSFEPAPIAPVSALNPAGDTMRWLITTGMNPDPPQEEKEPVLETCVPAVGWISSGFGERTHPISHKLSFHTGVDIAANQGTDAGAFAAGTVADTGYNDIDGHYVTLTHELGYESKYAHLERVLVKTGEEVTMGQPVGKVGSSGYTAGVHLHFELRLDGELIDPLPYLS